MDQFHNLYQNFPGANPRRSNPYDVQNLPKPQQKGLLKQSKKIRKVLKYCRSEKKKKQLLEQYQ